MSERIIFANFDLKNVKDPESNFYNIPDQKLSVLNGISKSLVLTLNNNKIPAKIVFSANGIDGIGIEDNTFNLSKTVYTGQKVYFTARLKSTDNYGVKNAPKLDFYSNTELYKMNLSCIDKFNQLVESAFVANFETTDSLGGYFKGYFVVDNENTDIKIVSSVLTETGVVSGESNTFNVYHSGGAFNYRKINEDHDQTQYYKDLIFQDILTSKQNFFDNFLGTIVGNLSSNPNTLGIKVYEKISNFVSNNSDIDISNLNSFLSMLKSLDISVEEFKAIFPPDLLRVVDNLSINLSKQLGQRNQFSSNFDDKGYERSSVYGVNKSQKLDFLTHVIKPGEGTSFIIAKENFSGSFKLLNTNIKEVYGLRLVGDPGGFLNTSLLVSSTAVGVSGTYVFNNSNKLFENTDIRFKYGGPQVGQTNYFYYSNDNWRFHSDGFTTDNILPNSAANQAQGFWSAPVSQWTSPPEANAAARNVGRDLRDSTITLLKGGIFNDTRTYMLSDYKSNWGWGLILPPNLGKSNFIKLETTTSKDFLIMEDNYSYLRTQDFDPFEGNPENMDKFYTFYNYLSNTENSLDQKFIDFDNPNTKLENLSSFKNYEGTNGVVENIVQNLLSRKVLSLDNKVSEILQVTVEGSDFNTNFENLNIKYGIGGAAPGGLQSTTTSTTDIFTDQTILVDSDGNPIVLDDGDFIEILE